MNLDLTSLRQRYTAGTLRPSALIETLYARIEACPIPNIWISLLPRAEALASARALDAADPATLPLYGIPFAVKDNIDVAGIPTTAGCPDFAYLPERSAAVVAKLLDAGAILIGKTNLDQFATGLVGTRSPYGAVPNAFHPDYIAGGSSSGSAVAVAAGLVSFALGTDTAGSGRVPAGFNNLVGLKPTRGRISTEGVFPACRSLDCVSIFALTCADAAAVMVCAADERRRTKDEPTRHALHPSPFTHSLFRFGILPPHQRQFFGNCAYAEMYETAIAGLAALGGTPVEINYTPFQATADLLYNGPWVAERYAAIREFFHAHSDALLPITRQIIGRGQDYTAVDLFESQYKLEEYRRQSEAVWETIDLLLLPTAPTHYTLAEVEAEPMRLNSNLGLYTNFVNLLDLCALAVPVGFTPAGLPGGVTLVAPAFADEFLSELGHAFHTQRNLPMGATEHTNSAAKAVDTVPLAVFGLHLSGQPLNHQLTNLGATLREQTQTAPQYRLYAIHDHGPAKPGAIYVTDGSGAAIALEVWDIPVAGLGEFVRQIPPPLGIGTVRLADGSTVKGFICESYIADTAEEITHLGGWLAYLAD